MSVLDLSLDGGVAVITLNRPEKRNSINAEMMVRLADAWTWVREHDGIRVAVLTGVGGDTFSAGSDLRSLITLLTLARAAEDEWDERLLTDQRGVLNRAMLRTTDCPTPIVAAACLAGGMELERRCSAFAQRRRPQFTERDRARASTRMPGQLVGGARMATAEKKSMTREEQIELQRQVTAAHIQGENDGEYEGVRQTFVQDERSYFDCVPGGIHFDGTSGIQGWYDILGALLPDLKIEVTHEYDTIGCCLREMTASGTHSLEFAGVKPTGKPLKWEAIALYIFDEEEPGKLLGERAYWDNDALIKQMKGEEAPPLVGLSENPRILEHNSVKSVHKRT